MALVNSLTASVMAVKVLVTAHTVLPRLQEVSAPPVAAAAVMGDPRPTPQAAVQRAPPAGLPSDITGVLPAAAHKQHFTKIPWLVAVAAQE